MRFGLLVVLGAAVGSCSSAQAREVAESSTIAQAPTVTQALVIESTTTTDAALAGAAALAQELSAVEVGIRDPATTASELAELGRRQQLVYRAINRHPEWHADVTMLVEPIATVPLGFHLAARQALADHAAGKPPTDPATTLPAWTIVDPLPIEELRGYYAEAEAATGVPWQYLAAIHFQETRMGRIVGVSSAGAVGPMQFLPSTWQQCCAGRSNRGS